LKQEVLKACEADAFKSFGSYEVRKRDTLDGYKYFFDNEQWLMIRASGTEPVLRLYAEGADMAKAQAILDACRKTIGA
jgi:phosphomannomutase